LTLEFVTMRENTILVAAQGLGKTMLAKNFLHVAVLAGHSARFITCDPQECGAIGSESDHAAFCAR
jgi:hypothetical protein